MPNELSQFRGAPGVERAKDIIERMRAHDIPPTPANYEIWTAYVAGVRPELSAEIEARLATGVAFDRVELLLRQMVASGYVSVTNDFETGIVLYNFHELD